MVIRITTYLLVLFNFITFGQVTTQTVVESINVPLNGEFYSPTYKVTELVVCGTRKDRIAYTHLDKEGDEPIDLYVLDPENGFISKRFDTKFRSDFHDGPISFNEDGTLCVISRNLRLDERFKAVQEDENHLGLFQSTFENGIWSDPIPLALNSDDYNCTHPALSLDGNVLLFSSNRPGGFGGYDVWKIEKTDGKWGEPQNLGNEVNSSSNEFFPSWMGSTMYFSVNKGVFGGLDLYRIRESENGFRSLILDEPLNSEKDDFGLTSKDNGESGFFSSNRGGADQIWSFKTLFPEFDECDSLVNDDFCYTLFEETAYELGGIESLVYEWDINGEKKYGYEVDYCFPGPGEYYIQVDIIDTIVKKVYANQARYNLVLTLEEQPYISTPDTVKIGQSILFDHSKTHLPGVRIDSYYWIISDGTRYALENPFHTFSELGNFQITLGIIGEKDGEAFMDCSYKGIVVVSEPVNLASISPKTPMLSFKEEGKLTQREAPVIPTDSLTIVHRIEIATSPTILPDSSHIFDLISSTYSVNTTYLTADSMYLYSVGEWLNIADAHETWNKIIEMGYEDAKICTHQSNSLQDLPINKSFSLENIEFQFNKSELTEEAEETLEILVLLLKEYKDVKLAVIAHTDNIGTSENNMILSQERARSIREYLISAGIAGDRIKTDGLGESKPLATNDTPEGRQMNRRVEFELITN